MSTETITPVCPSQEKQCGRSESEHAATVSRRDFIVMAAAGLALGFVLPSGSRRDGALGADLTPDAAAAAGNIVNTWLTVGADETITLSIGSSDMGSGSPTGLAQLLAEDLMVDIAKVKITQGAPTLSVPAPIGAAINTVGSSVTRTNYWKMRDAGATAREMLVQAAMNAVGDQTRTNYTVASGVITYTPTGQTITYGQVAAAAALLPAPVGAPLVPDSQFRIIGKTVPRFDIPLKVDGSAKYGIDIQLDKMVYAVIKHSPALGGTLASTPRVPSGMIAVVPTKVIAGTGRGLEAVGNVNAVAVVGDNTWDTWQAARGLSVKWTPPANAALLNSAQFLADAQALVTTAVPYAAGAVNGPGTLYTVEGDTTAASAAYAGSTKQIDSTYNLPYVPHACMEVLNCTVDYVAGVRCDVYAPTQSAKSALSLVVTLTGLQPSQVTIHTTFLGGGLGRKAEVDFISQAVQVGMALGRPVKLMYPREEDFTHDQYRPMALVHATAGLDSTGAISSLSYRNISPSILAQRGAVLGPKGDSQGIEGANNLPYKIGSRVVEYVTHPSPIPVGFWRSVGASVNTFAVESLIDELAVAAGVDGYTFRRNNLSDPRWIAVLDAVATLSGWNTKPATGRYRGIAIGTAFNSIVAEVVEISSVTATSLRVNKVSVAIDAYVVVNPGQVEAQLTGGVVHGMNAALYGKQTFVGGAAQTKNFNNSRMIRLGEMPEVAVTIIPSPASADRTQAIGGVGELGVPTFAPALANAYYQATKKRQRSLPFFPTATMSDG